MEGNVLARIFFSAAQPQPNDRGEAIGFGVGFVWRCTAGVFSTVSACFWRLVEKEFFRVLNTRFREVYMNYRFSIAFVSLLITGMAIGQLQGPTGLQQPPPPGTDLAPASVTPAQPKAESQPSKRPATKAGSAKAKAHSSKSVGARFAGTLKAVDKVGMTVTVESNGKSTTYCVTSSTRIFKDKKPATLADGVIGEPVSGAARKTKDGKLELVTVNFGGKGSAKQGTASPR